MVSKLDLLLVEAIKKYVIEYYYYAFIKHLLNISDGKHHYLINY